MNKHTPGPWVVSTNNPRTVKHASGPVLADCGPMNNSEAFANARLIAAAPDLLAALLHVMPHVGPGYSGKQRYDILETARAAIAKATGRE